MVNSKFLEDTAKDLVDKYKLSTSATSWELKLLKDLLMLRDAEILAQVDMESVGRESSDTLPPKENDAITLVDNRVPHA